MATSTIKNTNKIGYPLDNTSEKASIYIMTVAPDNTLEINTSGTTRGLMVVNGSSSGLKGLYIVSSVNNSYTDVKAISEASTLTFTTGTNKWTLKNNGSSDMHILCIIYRGSISI